MKKEKTVYVGMCGDIINVGHIAIINEASKHGKVIVGVLTDEAIRNYKGDYPVIDEIQRMEVIFAIKGVDKVTFQNSLDYTMNLELHRPDFVVHGDDWKTGVQQKARQKVIDVLKRWGGKLIEIPYTSGVSSTLIKKKVIEVYVENEKI